MITDSYFFIYNLFIHYLFIYFSTFCRFDKDTKTSKTDVTTWLTYWLIFGAFKIVESLTDVILGSNFIYFLAKAAFLGWCMYPGTQVLYFDLYMKIMLQQF